MPVDQGWGCAIDAVLIRPWRQPANWGGGSIDGSSGTVVNIKFLALAGVDHDTKLFALNMCSLMSVSAGQLPSESAGGSILPALKSGLAFGMQVVGVDADPTSGMRPIKGSLSSSAGEGGPTSGMRAMGGPSQGWCSD